MVSRRARILLAVALVAVLAIVLGLVAFVGDDRDESRTSRRRRRARCLQRHCVVGRRIRCDRRSRTRPRRSIPIGRSVRSRSRPPGTSCFTRRYSGGPQPTPAAWAIRSRRCSQKPLRSSRASTSRSATWRRRCRRTTPTCRAIRCSTHRGRSWPTPKQRATTGARRRRITRSTRASTGVAATLNVLDEAGLKHAGTARSALEAVTPNDLRRQRSEVRSPVLRVRHQRHPVASRRTVVGQHHRRQQDPRQTRRRPRRAAPTSSRSACSGATSTSRAPDTRPASVGAAAAGLSRRRLHHRFARTRRAAHREDRRQVRRLRRRQLLVEPRRTEYADAVAGRHHPAGRSAGAGRRIVQGHEGRLHADVGRSLDLPGHDGHAPVESRVLRPNRRARSRRSVRLRTPASRSSVRSRQSPPAEHELVRACLAFGYVTSTDRLWRFGHAGASERGRAQNDRATGRGRRDRPHRDRRPHQLLRRVRLRRFATRRIDLRCGIASARGHRRVSPAACAIRCRLHVNSPTSRGLRRAVSRSA